MKISTLNLSPAFDGIYGWISVNELNGLMSPGQTYQDKGWSQLDEYVAPDGTIFVLLGKN